MQSLMEQWGGGNVEESIKMEIASADATGKSVGFGLYGRDENELTCLPSCHF